MLIAFISKETINIAQQVELMKKNCVEETLNNYVKALATQSWESVETFFHENVTVIFAEGTYYGKDQVGGAIHKTFSLIRDEDFSISNLQWTIRHDNFATCTFVFDWSGTINGKRFTSPGRGTIAWVNLSNNWQIINEHFGPLPR